MVTCVAGRDVIIADVVHIKLLRGFLFLWFWEVINKLAKIFFEEMVLLGGFKIFFDAAISLKRCHYTSFSISYYTTNLCSLVLFVFW